MCHSKPGLSGPRGSNPEHEGVAAQCTDVRILRRGTCAHRPLAQVDLLETCSRVGRIVIKQRYLSDGQADGALEIARGKLAALLEALETAPAPPVCTSRASTPNRLFEPASVILTAPTLPIRACGAMT